MELAREEVRRLHGVIEKRADKAASDMNALQDSCRHPAATKKHGASTGHYDPHDDCYWTDFVCPDCGKRWRVEGSV